MWPKEEYRWHSTPGVGAQCLAWRNHSRLCQHSFPLCACMRLTICVHITVDLHRHAGQWRYYSVETWSPHSIVIDGSTVYGTIPHMLKLWQKKNNKHETGLSWCKSTMGLWWPLLANVCMCAECVPGCRASWAFISVLGRMMLMKHPGLLFTLSTKSVRLWSWFWTDIQRNHPVHIRYWVFSQFFKSMPKTLKRK